MFINEYISAGDMKKFGIEEAVYRYVPGSKHRGVDESSNLMWTVDKEDNIFLVLMRAGREEFSNRLTWMFFFKGKEFRIEADSMGSPTQKLSDPVFYRKWEIIEIAPVTPTGKMDQQTSDKLIEAFVSYGYGGARKQLPNTVVTVNINCN